AKLNSWCEGKQLNGIVAKLAALARASRLLWAAAASFALGWPAGAVAQTFTEVSIPPPHNFGTPGPRAPTAGHDGTLVLPQANITSIGRITTAGLMTEYPTLPLTVAPSASRRDPMAHCGSLRIS